ncbi:mechanosensitive ion channel family protein [Roseivivax jejudonensis]|nr:mechanosensitive ion channel family protein [Roseivivax jejudonensis]
MGIGIIRKIVTFAAATALVILLLLGAASAQIPGLGGAAGAEEASPTAADPLGRDTPRGLVTGLIAALGESDLEQAGRFLRSDAAANDIASWEIRRIESTLNSAVEFVPPTELSLVPEGDLDDGLPADRERVGRLGRGDSAVPMIAEKVVRDEIPVWVLSSASVDALLSWRSTDASGLARFQAMLGNLPAGPDVRGIALRDWLLLVAFAAISYILAYGLTAIRALVTGFVGRKSESERLARFAAISEPPLRLFIAALIFTFGAGQLGVSVVARYQLSWVVELTAFVSAAWFLWRVIDVLAEIMLGRMSRRGAITAYSAVTFLTRVLKTVIVAVVTATALRAFGVDITAGLAALGVGGLALAFGAQKLIENLIGSVTLIADRPVRVGDFCRFGETYGTVEEIGIRSTRVRTLGRTIVTVPNGEFSSLHLENFTRRDDYWFHHTIGVRYETSPRQMRALLGHLKSMLLEHPRVSPDPARVRLLSFGAHSLDIELFAYIHASDWNQFLEIQEELMLRMMEIVEGASPGFAFPSQTLYLARDGNRVGEQPEDRLSA